MLSHRVLKVSPHGSFPVKQLGESVAIGEAVNGERVLCELLIVGGVR